MWENGLRSCQDDLTVKFLKLGAYIDYDVLPIYSAILYSILTRLHCRYLWVEEEVHLLVPPPPTDHHSAQPWPYCMDTGCDGFQCGQWCHPCAFTACNDNNMCSLLHQLHYYYASNFILWCLNLGRYRHSLFVPLALLSASILYSLSMALIFFHFALLHCFQK